MLPMDRRFATALILVLGLLELEGCIKMTPLAPGAPNVRVISEEQANGCKFLDSISTNSGVESGAEFNPNPEQEARTRAFNKVAKIGGNALRITSTSSQQTESGGSIFSLSGDAYSCQSPQA